MTEEPVEARAAAHTGRGSSEDSGPVSGIGVSRREREQRSEWLTFWLILHLSCKQK